MREFFRLDDSEEESDKPEVKPSLAKLLLESRTALLFGEISMKSVMPVIAQLLALDTQSNDPIKLFINSPGGHVEAGDSLYDTIRFIRSPVQVIGTGWVASAGNHIYLAAEKENRFALPNTRFLIHQPLGAVRGQAVDVAIEARQMILMKQRLQRIIAERTGQPLERVQEDTERNHWMTASEAVEYGIVGRVIETVDDIDKA